MIPTDTEIDYFLELYRTLHFTHAAIRLGVTQPTLTQSILRLEGKVGDKLFHRAKSGCRPTRTGKMFYKHARELKDNWNAFKTLTKEDEENISGHYTLGCHPSIGAYTLPPFFQKMLKRAPLVEVSLKHDVSRNLTEQVISFEVDLAFVVNPVRHPDLVIKKLATDKIVFWKAKGISDVPKRLFTDWSHSEMAALLKGKHCDFLQDHQLIETSSLELIRSLVLNGSGIGFLPERVAKADGSLLTLAQSQLPHVNDEICLIYRHDTLKSSAGQALIEAANVQL